MRETLEGTGKLHRWNTSLSSTIRTTLHRLILPTHPNCMCVIFERQCGILSDYHGLLFGLRLLTGHTQLYWSTQVMNSAKCCMSDLLTSIWKLNATQKEFGWHSNLYLLLPYKPHRIYDKILHMLWSMTKCFKPFLTLLCPSVFSSCHCQQHFWNTKTGSNWCMLIQSECDGMSKRVWLLIIFSDLPETQQLMTF